MSGITKNDLIPFPKQIRQAVFLDVNTRFGKNGKSLLLADVQAVNNSLSNLFACPIGDRGRIGQPTYGTFLYHLIHEPLLPETAARIRATLIQSIEKWEPRIQLDHAFTHVFPNKALPGYDIQVAYYFRLSNQYETAKFQVEV